METKKEYIAPELTVVEFKTERGYAASSDNPLAAIQILSNFLTNLNGGNIEAWTLDDNNTFDGDGFTWQ